MQRELPAGLAVPLRRFLRGEFSDGTPNALFDEAAIDKWRVAEGEELPPFVRVVVSVDPSGASDDEATPVMHVAAPVLGADGRILGVLTVAKANQRIQPFIDKVKAAADRTDTNTKPEPATCAEPAGNAGARIACGVVTG